MLIKTNFGFLNLANVTSITIREDESVIAHDTRGQVHDLEASYEALRIVVSTTPAQPGLRVLHAWMDRDGFNHAIGAEVVAWALMHDGSTAPITTTGLYDDDSGEHGDDCSIAYLHPSGHVADPFIGFNRFSCIGKWLEWCEPVLRRSWKPPAPLKAI